MSKKNKFKKVNKNNPVRKGTGRETVAGKPWNLDLNIILVLIVTTLAYISIFNNSFTNWDDDYYVTINNLLREPDWKGIFTQPVVGNYHPLTVLSFAFNYQLSGLSPFSYFLLNLLLHLANTYLVYRFIMIISGEKKWVAIFCALIFGIHPMHVESVAWVSERKDVLYTFFFLLSLIQYWKYIKGNNNSGYWYSLIFFTLSLMSKPAAIILPVILYLLDYWKGRSMSKKLHYEKMPFFILSIIFTLLTLKAQTIAIAGLEVFPLWTRFFFATYSLLIYSLKFFIPYSLSTFHPFPSVNDLGLLIYQSPIFVAILAVALVYFRKNKLVIFSVGFFIVNLLLVLQIVSIGNTLISERYTYVPYIGLSFLFGMLLNNYLKGKTGLIGWSILGILIIVFGYLTFQQTKVWQNSEVLWTNVIKKHPEAPLPRSSRADAYHKKAIDPANQKIKDSLLNLALKDCDIAIKNGPNIFSTYRTRGMINLLLNRNKEAIEDATKLISISKDLPAEYANAFLIRGTGYMHNNDLTKAIDDFNTCLSLSPMNDNAYANRGVCYYKISEFNKALEDYNKAISINPAGDYFLNRSSCYYMMGQMDNARADAIMAAQKGTAIPENYKVTLQIK